MAREASLARLRQALAGVGADRRGTVVGIRSGGCDARLPDPWHSTLVLQGGIATGESSSGGLEDAPAAPALLEGCSVDAPEWERLAPDSTLGST